MGLARFGEPIPRQGRSAFSWVKFGITGAAAVIYGLSFWETGTSPKALLEGLPRIAEFAFKMWPGDFSDLPHLFGKAGETLQMAVMGTVLATLGALPLSALAARNISPSPLIYQGARLLLDTFRGISELVWALLFVAMVGLGPFTGVLALSIHNTGALGKYFSEAIEAINREIIESVSSTGASGIQVFIHGVIPELRTLFMNYILYYFDHNLRQATVLGVVGAGGIGLELLLSMQYYQYRRVLTIVLVMLFLVIAADRISALIRKRLLGGEILTIH